MSSPNNAFRAFLPILRFCGAITLGIVLMIALAVVMSWATFLERDMGTPAAQFIVYASPWFYLLVAALCVNIVCSAIIRVPRIFQRAAGKKRVSALLFPFFLAHLAVVLLAIGCLVTANKSSKARVVIPEGTAAEKAVDVDSRSIEIALNSIDDPSAVTNIDLPFAGGPMNWRNFESLERWEEEVAKPILDQKGEKKFFNRLGKKASALSQRFAYRAALLGKRNKSGVLYDKEGLKIEALEYAVNADYAPVQDLKGTIQTRDADGNTRDLPLLVTFPFSGSFLGGDPLATTQKSQRATLDEGIRFTYIVADSDAELDAFLQLVPQRGETNRLILSLDSQQYSLPVESLERLSQYGDLEGQLLTLQTQREEIERRLATEREYIQNAPEPVAPVQQEPTEENGESVQQEPTEENGESVQQEPTEGNGESVQQEPTEENGESVQQETTEENGESVQQEPTEENGESVQQEPTEGNGESVQQEPIEENGEPVSLSVSAVDVQYSQENALDAKAKRLKPCQTVTRESLVALNDELSALSDALVKRADAATDPDAEPFSGHDEYKKASEAYSKKRTQNYLAMTWSQLETSIPTSAQFCETLEKMLDDTTRREEQIQTLRDELSLGDSGWRVLNYETVPTQAQGVDELYGWSARVLFETPQGESLETFVYTELPERNRYPESGRVFASLWREVDVDEETIYGRKWNANLNAARLDVMQSPSGRVAYRYSSGTRVYATGELQTTPSAENSELLVANAVQLPNATSTVGALPVSFKLDACPLQDALGARLLPTLFDKEKANEFYGRLKLRVTLDDACETFWLQTIPLESVDKDQISTLVKTIASSKRRAQIRLSDKEIDLGVAIYVKKFTPVYEPGSSTPASFSSLTRILPVGLSPEEQAQAVAENPERDTLIQMNRPGVLKAPGSDRVFWAYQDSFRGPYKPGDKEFDSVVQGKILPGEDSPRDAIYYTILSLNDDPGRGLKYLASLFLVWGTALLIYNKRKGRRDSSADETPVADAQDRIDESMREEKTPQAPQNRPQSLAYRRVLLFFLVAFALVFAAVRLTANYGDASVNYERFKTAQTIDVPADKIDWTPWKSLPVYDGGRRLPLYGYARVFVNDLTGDFNPILALPSTIVNQLESDAPYNFPSLEEFLADVGEGADADEKTLERQKEWYATVCAEAVARQKELAARLRALFPGGIMKAEPSALLFMQLAEPELWEYVPFIADKDGLVAREVLKRDEGAILMANRRLSPSDIDELMPGTDKTRAEIYLANPHADAKVVKALEKARRDVDAWRSFVFVPTQSRSSRPTMRLNSILYGSMPSGHMGVGMQSMAASPMSRLENAASNLEALLSREKRALRKTSPLNDKDHLLRKRVELADNPDQDTLALARKVALLGDVYKRYPLATGGRLFNELLVQASDALKELREHRDAIMREETFSLEYRQELERAVSALGEIVDALEDASLALTTDEPKSLNITPLVSKRAMRTGEATIVPWVSLQTHLWGADELYARFVDPTAKIDDKAEAPSLRAGEISPFELTIDALKKTRESQRTARPEVDAFIDAVVAFRDAQAPDRIQSFNEALARFAYEVRAIFDRVEPLRAELAQNASDRDAANAYLAKTCYPRQKILNAELLYYDFNAFYWNWVACLIASILFLLAHIAGLFGAKKEGESGKVQKGLFALGFVALLVGCGVATCGCAIRAYITGWAPVANMFETVVLLALLIATIAIGFVLAPMWKEPYLAAWRAGSFSRATNATSRAYRLFALTTRVVPTAWLCALGVRLWLREHDLSQGVVEAIRLALVDAVTMQGILDAAAVFGVFLFVVWCVPRIFSATLTALFFRTNLWTGEESARVSERAPLLTASALVATLVAAAAYFNSVEFNPNIRPLVAVLRSNFWLTIHVLAIIVSYALGAIAWFVSLSALWQYAFGRYGRDGRFEEPSYSVRISPMIATMLRSAVLFLTVGIILGARWADFSWGRFWSWDPKEVWALVTLLVYLVVLHAHRLSGRSRFVLAIGATVGAFAIIMTWYGLSFIMGGGGRHAYTGGESNKVAVLYALLAINIVWCLVASARYYFEKLKIARAKK